MTNREAILGHCNELGGSLLETRNELDGNDLASRGPRVFQSSIQLAKGSVIPRLAEKK